MTPFAPHDDAAADDRAGVADEHLAPSITSGPWWTPADEVHDRRPQRVRGRQPIRRATAPTSDGGQRARGGRARRRPRRTPSRSSGKHGVPEHLRRRPSRRRRAPPPTRAAPSIAERVHQQRSAAPSSSAPSGSAAQPGWYGSSTVVDLHVEREPDPEHQARGLDAATSDAPRARSAIATRARAASDASRDSTRPLSVYDTT